MKSPKIGKVNIDTLIIPQGLLIHEKIDQKISLYCPFEGNLALDMVLELWFFTKIENTIELKH